MRPARATDVLMPLHCGHSTVVCTRYVSKGDHECCVLVVAVEVALVRPVVSCSLGLLCSKPGYYVQVTKPGYHVQVSGEHCNQ